MGVTECDLLIVGAGPVGLCAAYYAGFRGLRTALVDSLPRSRGPGRQLVTEMTVKAGQKCTAIRRVRAAVAKLTADTVGC